MASTALSTGTGSPEGRITAPIGAEYIDAAATMGAIRWVKTTSSGATGWRVTEGETGWRNLTGLIPGVISGTLHAARFENDVWLNFHQLTLTDPATSFHQLDNVLPVGWRPQPAFLHLPLAPPGTAETPGPVRVASSGQIVIYNVKPQKRMTGLVAFPAAPVWPSASHGTPS